MKYQVVIKLFNKDGGVDQKLLLTAFVSASLLLHALTLIASHLEWFATRHSVIEEWSIETDLVSDIDAGSVDKTIIPDAKESEKTEVPSNLLPQITKSFAIEQPKSEQQGIIEDPAIAEKSDGKDEEKNDQMVETSPKDDVKILKKNEALKRLVMEKLRREQKEKTKVLTAEKNDALAALKDAANNGSSGSNSVGGILTSAASRKYQAYLTKAIRRNYSLPKNYKFSSAKSMVLLAIKLDARGNLLNVNIEQSSGDAILDNYCIEAVQRSTPFDTPPKDLMGTIIQVNFKP